MVAGIIFVIVLIFMVVMLNHENNVDKKSKVPASSPSNKKNDKIDPNFSHVAIDFFNGYLSLCKAHQVAGHAYLQQKAEENTLSRLDFELECEIFAVDGEDASFTFDVVRRVISDEQNQISLQVSDTIERIRKQEEARDNQMKSYYHCDNLFYPFYEIDEYEFRDRNIVIRCEYPIFASFGFRKDETFKYIKSELLQMWPEAKIDYGQYGMSVWAKQ